MGVVNSRPEENDLFLRDQNRFSIAALNITNNRNRTLLNIAPNAFPATRYSAKREFGDDSVIEYVQDPDAPAGGPPSFLIRLPNEDELNFNFTFIARQAQAPTSIYNVNNASTIASTGLVDTVINGLTFVFASSPKELDNLVTKEFHANPNLHKDPHVELVGDYSTLGSPSVQFQWTWKWKPPKVNEDRGGGWRTTCSFVEYDQRAHRLETLATFAFWVQNTKPIQSPKSPSPRLELGVPPRLRVPSAQSIESRVSDSDDAKEFEPVPPKSPVFEPIPEYGLGLVPSHATTLTNNTVKLDVSCSRPGEDLSQTEDGPLFRATMKSLEQKTGNMRARWKKVLKKAESALEAQVGCNNAMAELMEALRETSTSNANAVQPAIDHYFDKIAKEILNYERSNTANIQKLIIDPIHRLYNIDIKQAETKRKDFEEESKEYYQYLSRYLGQRQDSLKEKKRAETDIKYQSKRRNFELKRFDYSSFMQDLHGGRKDQQVLSHLTRYADAQAKNYLETAKKIETMLPQLDALSFEVKEADKEFQLQRTEREEKRRLLEKSKKPFDEPPASQPPPTTPANGSVARAMPASEPDLPGRKPSLAPVFQSTFSPPPTTSSLSSIPTLTSPQSPEISHASLVGGSPQPNKFKGFRDLEDKDYSTPHNVESGSGTHRKEGLLWALSRPGSHVDPKGLNKQAWHKFWIVLDQGKLSEYTNWKQSLELHMDPIDLRMASVREARNSERRFCFEVITPQFTRVYQATNEDDMKSWIAAVNNALQTAVESVGKIDRPSTDSLPGQTRRDIASVLTGKSPSLSSHKNHYASKTPTRHATVGERPGYRREESTGDNGKLLQQVRDADAGNRVCADCGSDSKVDWVSINLGIIICIECSGIHRSLGTHISKVRSLTLDTNSFTLDIVEILLKVGNRVSNMIWEARLDPAQKPGPTSTREQRLHFITSKYADRAFVAPISPTLSHYATPEETLLASVKKNDMQNVLYALALRADPNAKDRSRGTHSVFLALAAADPASPSASASPASSPAPGARPPSSHQPGRKSFPIAELLLQNGAELPTQPAPIPLSASARMYLEHKADQRAGRRPAPMVGSQPKPASGDTLAALPHIVAGNGSTPADRAREREARLQKRVSAGGRLVKHTSDSSEGRRGA
ncbi:ARF GTPase-like protein activator [Lentithecium fluviatile CBS 122367]|uniref:ADP-ribosylation factor GTPase-activating protein n=1 Tax=Lentithecium fluviatile CBS 122367 TaxID=1168545 RepID=A0A6G1J346_9PLEO|nr:ARF GTPase-like protein activator [Lentithecium fluviatile CBS 122367]